MTYSCFPFLNLASTMLQSFISTPVATNTRNECLTARALKVSAPLSPPLEPPFSLADPLLLEAGVVWLLLLLPPSIIFSTAATVGTFLFTTRDFDRIYLCRAAYSLADMVYRSALRRIGSEVVLAVIFDGLDRGRPGPDGRGAVPAEGTGAPDIVAVGIMRRSRFWSQIGATAGGGLRSGFGIDRSQAS